MNERMVIVGAGQAGLQIAESLRAEGFGGAIGLLAGEKLPPYQRPPLSKAWLQGDLAEDRLFLRGAEALAAKNIDLRLGVVVTEIDRAGKAVRLADGSSLAYSGLALATGARARRPALPGADLAGVCVLRDMADAREISHRMDAAQNMVVIGGGFIGLEVAATARKRGLPVIVIEALDRLMARAVTPRLSAFFADVHRMRGVDVVFGAQVAALEGRDGAVTAVVTATGQKFSADLVIFGIGAAPNDELAAAAGLEVARGIVVDSCGRTSDPHIVAAGDCTVFRRDDGKMLRLESVQNAVEQAKAAAAALLGREKPFDATPWFWSDQYEFKLQMAGLSEGFDVCVERPGSGAAFSLFYYRDGRLIAVDSVNRPGEHLLARKMLDAGVSPDPALAANPASDLRALLR
jgi:3-phenylpropionate/trans-cinnamate dioxygenase ferredoxin reductase component